MPFYQNSVLCQPTKGGSPPPPCASATMHLRCHIPSPPYILVAIYLRRHTPTKNTVLCKLSRRDFLCCHGPSLKIGFTQPVEGGSPPHPCAFAPIPFCQKSVLCQPAGGGSPPPPCTSATMHLRCHTPSMPYPFFLKSGVM